jgi:hypothetical protein
VFLSPGRVCLGGNVWRNFVHHNGVEGVGTFGTCWAGA